MIRHFQRWIPMFVGVALFGGCAATQNPNFAKGEQHLQKTEYDQAVSAFEKALQENPDNPAVKRELAVAYYHKKQFSKAISLLTEAISANSRDERALFYLGISYECINDISKALDTYRTFLNAATNNTLRKSIEARVTGLVRKRMAEEAKAVLANEKSINPAAIPDNTIAVLYFKNTSKKPELELIQKGMAEMLITDLSQVNKLKVVERVRMQKMLDELGMGQTGIVQESSAPRVGRFLGASKLVQGEMMDIGKDDLSIYSDFVAIKKSSLSPPKKIQGKMAELFKMEKDLTFSIIDRLGIKLSQNERDAIKIIPTENLLAFMAYCKGLDREDRGQFKEAALEYQKAVKLDPNFKYAVQGVSRSEKLIDSQFSVSKLEAIYNQAQISPGTASAAASKTTKQTMPRTQTVTPLVDHLLHTAGVLDQGFLPGVDSRKATVEGNQSSFGNTVSFDVRITLPNN